MRSGLVVLVLVVLAVVGYMSIYIVNPTQQALVLQLGRIIEPRQEPGFYFKYPVVQNIVYLDKRVLNLDMPPLEPISSDKKRLVVDAFARYRISDPVLFYQRVRDVETANLRLSTLLQSSLRSELGKTSFVALVRDDRSGVMEAIRNDVSANAKELGIEVVDVKIRRADLPDANSQAIYDRMKTERQREATEIRAQGTEAARRIRSRADRDATVLVAEANRDSEIIRGDGDAERNKIFAEAFGEDPEFFAFYRSMQAYEAGLQQGDTSLVLSPDSSFFRFFKDPAGAGAPAANNDNRDTGSSLNLSQSASQ